MALRTNLMLDPGNEAASTLWVGSATVTASHSTTFKQSGTQSLKLLKGGSGSMVANFGADAASVPNAYAIPVTVGDVMTFSAYLRHDNQVATSFVSLLWMSDTAFISSTASTSVNTTTAFARYSVTGTAPAGATKVAVNFTTNTAVTAGNSIFLDDMLLEKTAILGNWFNGSSVNPGLYYAWTATVNGSTSTETNVPPGSTVLLDDTFNRADSTTVVGSPQTGPAPVIQSGVGGISGNQLYSSTITLITTYDLGVTDVDLRCVGNLMTNGLALVLGFTAVTDYYFVFWQYNVGVYLYQVPLSQSALQLTFSAVKLPALNGVMCKASYSNGVIRAYVDDVQVLRWTLATPITSTKHGVRIANTGPRMDNLLGLPATVINEDRSSGDIADFSESLVAVDKAVEDAAVYKGRDTKIQDAMAGA